MFTDIVGSTHLANRLGDDALVSLVREHDRLVRNLLQTWGGTEVKHTGDGIMASFPSSSTAIQFAAELQRGLAKRNSTSGPHLEVRIGMAAGEPVSENGDLFGAVVQLAARLCQEAGPGEVLVASVVRDLTVGKGFQFESCEAISLRGFEEPACPYRLIWES